MDGGPMLAGFGDLFLKASRGEKRGGALRGFGGAPEYRRLEKLERETRRTGLTHAARGVYGGRADFVQLPNSLEISKLLPASRHGNLPHMFHCAPRWRDAGAAHRTSALQQLCVYFPAFSGVRHMTRAGVSWKSRGRVGGSHLHSSSGTLWRRLS